MLVLKMRSRLQKPAHSNGDDDFKHAYNAEAVQGEEVDKWCDFEAYAAKEWEKHPPAWHRSVRQSAHRGRASDR